MRKINTIDLSSLITDMPQGKSGITIKKSHRGLLHKNLGVPEGESIPASKLAIKSGDSTAIKKRKQFAINAKKWHHAEDGLTLPDGRKLIDNRAPNYAWSTSGDNLPANPAFDSWKQANAIPVENQSNFSINPASPLPDKKKGRFNTDNYLYALSAIDALVPAGDSPRKYNRPEDNIGTNLFQNGTGSQAIMKKGGEISPTKAREILHDGIAHGKKLTDKQRRFFGAQLADGDTITPPTGYKPSTPQQRTAWNKFLQYLYKQGVSGSKDLDVRDRSLGMKHLEEFNKTNPDFIVDQTFIPTAQYEQTLMRKQGKFPGLTDEQSKMIYGYMGDTFRNKEVSPVDGWLGSKTSQLAYNPILKSGDSYGNKKYNYDTNYEDFVKGDDPSIMSKYEIKPTNVTAKMAEGGQVQPRKSIITSNPNDPRLKAYQDSSIIHSVTKKDADSFDKVGTEKWYDYTKDWEKRNPDFMPAYRRLERINGKSPVGVDEYGTGPTGGTIYKRPVQPVILQPWERMNGQIVETPNNVPQINQTPHQVSGNPLNLQQVTEGDYSITHPKSEYLNQETIKFKNKREWKDFLQNNPKYNNYTEVGKNSGTASYPKVVMKNGGQLSEDGLTRIQDGSSIEQISNNPFDGGTQQFNGPSHEEGGIRIAHKGVNVEVEGAETKVRDTVMGNMFVPGSRKKFKNVIKDIANKENKISSVKDKAMKLADEATPIDGLKLNTSRIMLEGSTLKQKDLAEQKDWLVNMQQAMLDTADEHGIDAQEMSKGVIKKAKNGARIAVSGDDLTNWDWIKNRPMPKEKSNMLTPINRNLPGVGITKDGQPIKSFPSIPDGVTSVQNPIDSGLDNSPAKLTGTDLSDWNPVFSTKKPTTSNASGLNAIDIAPEIVALGNNRVQPVKSQRFTPDLFQSYDISLQAARNNVTSAQRAANQQLGYNPAAAASIAGSTQEQLANISEKEFQINQGNKADVIAKNTSIVNDAKLRNIGIDDTQYIRQEQARSNTRTQQNEILKSISSKVLQNNMENKRLKLYENLYNYRFDPATGEAIYEGPDTNFTGSFNNSSVDNTRTRTLYDKDGKLKSTTVMQPGDIDTEIKRLQSLKSSRTIPLTPQNVVSKRRNGGEINIIRLAKK